MARELLKGKTALVTGGSRDIGARIVTEFARDGAHVVSNYRDKRTRAEGVAAEIRGFGGTIDFLQADITDPADIEKLYDQVASLKVPPRLDLLVLNASGPGRDVNVTAANRIVDRFLPTMPEGSKLILMQSVPGHYFGQLETDRIPEFYRPIAEAKYEGEASLRDRIPEFDRQGVIFNIVVPPEVPDTNNIKIFTRRYGSGLSELHAALSDDLGLPAVVDSEHVGLKVAELASSETPQGYVELFKGE